MILGDLRGKATWNRERESMYMTMHSNLYE